ncbi:MAG: hypothetical protein JO332_00540, partial [Planctomycetaceae bacterium]|nr:hypothetical protein [Planctomycetaceae bacterium]
MLLVLCAAFLLQGTEGQRILEPEADAQKQAVKALKELFRDEYGRKSSAEQVDLAKKLLATSADPSIDMTTKYVCLAEARDLAVAAGDAALAMDAVGRMGKSYLVAVPAAKLAILNKLSTGVKDAEKVRGLSRAYYDLARDCVPFEDYDSAAAAATKAESLARAIKDPSMSDRVGELKKDLSTLKSEYQKVKSSIDNPATGDADAVGRYFCFVRNEWASGLKLLSESGKPPLKDLAAKDLANPETTEGQVEVGDGWWLQAQAEKIPWKKQNLLGRVRHWYEMAQPNATALVKVRVNKRLAEMESAAPGGGLNLLQ